MNAGTRIRLRTAILAFCLAGGGLCMDGCRRAPDPDTAAVEENAPEPVAETSAPPPAAGRHRLTGSPPVTVPDLDRLVDLGFNSDEIVAEIQRRGVLKLPEPAERAHIQRLPRGDRLLEVMESPANLLTAQEAIRWGLRMSGAPELEQWRRGAVNYPPGVAYPMQGQVQGVGFRQQQLSEYQNRHSALANRIAALRKQRTEMQKRGEMVGLIGIEIDRLERELGALVPPP